MDARPYLIFAALLHVGIYIALPFDCVSFWDFGDRNCISWNCCNRSICICCWSVDRLAFTLSHSAFVISAASPPKSSLVDRLASTSARLSLIVGRSTSLSSSSTWRVDPRGETFGIKLSLDNFELAADATVLVGYLFCQHKSQGPVVTIVKTHWLNIKNYKCKVFSGCVDLGALKYTH